MKLHFTVLGHPEPQGSVRAFMPKGWNRPVLTSDNKDLKAWRGVVAIAAQKACKADGRRFPVDAAAAVQIDLHFCFKAPKRGGGTYKTTRPDIDKLIRGVLDALTGIVYADDAQVVRVIASKEFNFMEGVEVFIESI
jgi:Holliday junction resolvase RusA-like endonuclease